MGVIEVAMDPKQNRRDLLILWASLIGSGTRPSPSKEFESALFKRLLELERAALQKPTVKNHLTLIKGSSDQEPG